METIKSIIVQLINEEGNTPNNEFPFLIETIGGISVLSIGAAIAYGAFKRKHR